MPSPIHHTFGPHIDRQYMRKMLAMSYTPWRYVHGRSIEKLRSALQEKFGMQAALFASGRESLLALLKGINLQSGEEVIIQGYTCIVIPNAIHAAGGVPIYADLSEETLNLTRESVAEHITPRTRAVICQHTFGIPSDTQSLRALCSAHGILLIEDCAHVLPDDGGPGKIGRIGDAMILSFGRDKAISGVAGGAVLVRDSVLATALLSLEHAAANLLWHEVMTLLEYGSRMRMIVRPLVGLGLSKPILAVLKRIGLFAPILTEREREGTMSPLLRKIPNACAFLTLHSLSKLKEINDHRRSLTNFYLQYGKEHDWPMLSGVRRNLPLQKFPLFVENADAKRAALKKDNAHLDDGWTGCVVCPDTVDMDATGYAIGSDPHAERACQQILSLPTHPTMAMHQAQRLAEVITKLIN